MGRQMLPRWMGGSLADLALAPTSASLLAPPRFAHAVTMRVRVISSSRRPIGTRVSDAVLLTAPSPPLRDGGRALSLSGAATAFAVQSSPRLASPSWVMLAIGELCEPPRLREERLRGRDLLRSRLALSPPHRLQRRPFRPPACLRPLGRSHRPQRSGRVGPCRFEPLGSARAWSRLLRCPPLAVGPRMRLR